MRNIVVEVQYMNKPILMDTVHGGTICHIKEYFMEDCFDENDNKEYDKILFDEIKKIMKEFKGIYSIRFFLRQKPDTLENLKKAEKERKEYIKRIKEKEQNRKEVRK